jgi:DnaK suppressor protein
MAFNASGLTDKQLAELKESLLKKQNSIESEIRDLEAALTEEDNDDQDSPDEVDRSSYEEEMQRTQLVLDGKKQLSFEVNEAIERLKEGTYGLCEETEEPIGFKRLQATPWTRLSLEAQQDLELKRKNRPRVAGGGYPSAYEPTSGGGDSDEE